jgi:hypothetical protein
VIQTGWNNFTDVTSGGNGNIYAVAPSGYLNWYKDTHQDGSGIVGGVATSFDAPNEGSVIGSGWNIFTQVIDGGGGILYGIDPTGNLFFYQDTHQDGSAGSFITLEGNVIATGWVLPTLEGYASTQSVALGGNLSFYVSTGGSNLTVTYLRLQEDLTSTDPAVLKQQTYSAPYGIAVSSPEQHPGQARPVQASQNWTGPGWEQTAADFSLGVPQTWQSGLYAAQVMDDRGNTLYIPFVVRPAPGQHNALAVIVNTNTWNAYDDWGGRGQYTSPNGSRLSFLRPNPDATPDRDVWDDATTNNYVAPSEVWFLSWLQANGYRVDVYTDADFDKGIPGVNSGPVTYQALLLDTHPEYWTINERTGLAGYEANGGDVFYLGGNGSFEAVGYDVNGTVLTLRNYGPGSPETNPRSSNSFRQPPVAAGGTAALQGLSERQVLGVAYESASGDPFYGNPTAPLPICQPSATYPGYSMRCTWFVK